jgi:serine/threonine-protein kinase
VVVNGGGGEADALIGRTIAGKFLIEKYLGGGAMGAVYLARQTALEKNVAIKVMHPRLAAEKTFATRFQREAKAASRLDHVNSVRMLDFGAEPDGLLYLAMEYLEGRTLHEVIVQDWPLPKARIVDLLSQALAALAVAHDMGVVHRDLKPENFMILPAKDDEGRVVDQVKVCDFGIAKLMDGPQDNASFLTGSGVTTQGVVVGTPEYMSPEQAKGETLDARSDLYAMGVILYQLLVGRVPFQADSAIEIVLAHVTKPPPPPREIYPRVDPELEAVCLRALRKDKAERYQSAREMRGDLRASIYGRDRVPSLAPLAAASSGSVSAIPVPEPAQFTTAPTVAGMVPPTIPDGSGPVPILVRTDGKVTPLGLPRAPTPRTWSPLVAVAAILVMIVAALATWLVIRH